MIFLDDAQFDSLFPFHIGITRDLKITSQGKSSIKLVGNLIGDDFGQHFEFVRPKLSISMEFQSLEAHQNTVVILENRASKMYFRGQFLYNQKADLLYYLNSPWLTDTKELEDYHLTISDFALHDTVTDNLQLLRSKEIVNQDLLVINKSLEEEKQKHKESEEKFKVLVETSSDIIYRVNSEGKYIYVNPTGAEITGYTVDEIIGQHYTFLLSEPYTTKLSNFYYFQLTQKIETTYIEFPITTKQGNEVWLGQSVNLVLVDENNYEYIALARDITDRKRAEKALIRSEEKYRSILENLELGLVEADKNNVIVKAYPRFCELVGYTENEIIGQNGFEILLDDEAKKIMHEQNQKRKEGHPSVYEIQLTRKDGTKIWCMISGAPYFDMNDEFMGTIGVHVDISERKKMEEELKIAKELAENSLKARELFMANMSHEIRTPLNAIVGMSELLLESNLSTQQRNYMQAIATSSESLLTIINDILSFSKIEAGKIELELLPNDLSHFLLSQQNLFLYKTQEKDIQFLMDNSVFETGYLIDTVRLGEVISNLLSNAIKFTSEGQIQLSCKVEKIDKETDLLHFSVTDTGIGIPEDKLETIFEHFTQASESITRNFGGTGLGLAISKELVNLMGGDLHVKSTLGQGSQFYFSLSFKKCEKPQVKKTISPIANEITFQGKKVLVVDDNELNILVAKSMLEKWKFEVYSCQNGLEAIEFLGKNHVDLIFMDIRMPKMGGVEASWYIREKLKLTTKIIALTANIHETDIDTYIQNGMSDVLKKPFRSEDLLNVLLTHISPKQTAVMEENLVDFTQLKASFGDDENMIKRMVNLFQETTPASLLEMQQAFKQHDWASIQKLAHKIKPSLYYVSISSLAQLAAEVETDQSNSIHEKSEQLMLKIEQLLEQLKHSQF